MGGGRGILRYVPNFLTVVRVVIAPIFVVALFGKSVPSAVWSLFLFAAACASDYLDGLIARRLAVKSRFGEFLDPLADKILTMSAFLSFALLRELCVPMWLVAVILARELVFTIVRTAGIAKGVPLKTELAGKLKTAVQMTAVIVVLALLLAARLLEGASEGGAEAFLSRPIVRTIPLLFVSLSAAAALLSAGAYLAPTAKSTAGEKPASRAGSVLEWVTRVLVTVCFIGYLPRFAGTAASVAGSLLWVLLSGSPNYLPVTLVVIAAGFVLAAHAQRRLFAERDSPRIVIDEVAGVLVTFLSFSFAPDRTGIILYAAGLMSFRLFDICKPRPIRALEKVDGGAGVMLDDLAAGVFANAVLQAARIFMRIVFPSP